MAERVVVTGIGIISALGTGTDAHTTALRSSASGVKPASILNAAHAVDFVLGEIHLTNDELSAAVGIPGGDNGYTRTALLALVAVHDLLETVDVELLRREPFAFINANTVGGMS